MTDHQSTLIRIPNQEQWLFGGYAYGVEPLTLPPAGAAATDGNTVPAPSANELNQAATLLTQVHRPRGDTLTALGHVPLRQELCWFRWVTGHQICFLLWRILAETTSPDNEPSTTAARTAQDCIDAYSAMLLYTGSCPRIVYESSIRPSMKRHHPSFSGSWAPDYSPVRALLRGRKHRFSPSTGVACAVHTNQRVHDQVAKWLVEDGISLLREAHVSRVAPDMAAMLYDTYFVTVRRPTTDWSLATQLLRRALVVIADLTENPLYQHHDPRAAEPEQWWTAHKVTTALQKITADSLTAWAQPHPNTVTV